MLRLLENPGLRTVMGEPSRRRILEEFTNVANGRPDGRRVQDRDLRTPIAQV